jgi:hypothetical protein
MSIQKEKEREILSKLFKATDGNNWIIRDGWMDESLDICRWYGVKCKEGSTVESILLGSNGLIGTIPTEIYEIQNLKFLWLYSNPVDLSFDGIAQATNLKSLLLDSTNIRSLNGIGLGRSLVDIDVRFNNLDGPIPSELSRLVNLETLTCSHNAFTGTVPELTAIRTLTTLRIADNKLEGTLPSFSKHPSLKSIDLSENSLVGSIPGTLLSSVADSADVYIDLSSNMLTGTVPGELTRFQDLTIFLRENRIEGINTNLCEETRFNNGDVGAYSCDGILCPPGTMSLTGRATDSGECLPCSRNQYFGSTTCGGSSGAFQSRSASVVASVVIAVTSLALVAFS